MLGKVAHAGQGKAACCQLDGLEVQARARARA